LADPFFFLMQGNARKSIHGETSFPAADGLQARGILVDSQSATAGR
jgi:hypothetical protein